MFSAQPELQVIAKVCFYYQQEMKIKVQALTWGLPHFFLEIKPLLCAPSRLRLYPSWRPASPAKACKELSTGEQNAFQDQTHYQLFLRTFGGGFSALMKHPKM